MHNFIVTYHLYYYGVRTPLLLTCLCPILFCSVLTTYYLLRLATAASYHSSVICRHSFVSFILTVFCGKLLETLYRYSVDHYVITRASVCVTARVIILTCKLCFFLHVHVSESCGTMILPACVMPLCLSCLLFTCHFASFSQ